MSLREQRKQRDVGYRAIGKGQLDIDHIDPLIEDRLDAENNFALMGWESLDFASIWRNGPGQPKNEKLAR
jgi:hypothetical protein